MTLLSITLPKVVAQAYSIEVWHYGEIMKKDSSVERGKISYSFSDEEIQIQTPTQIKIYHAKDLINFRFTDSISHKLRFVETIKYKTDKDYTVPGFFELMKKGQDMSLVKREYLMQYAVTDGLSGFVSYQKQLEVDYFYVKNGGIYFLTLKPKKFFEIFGAKEFQIKEYYKTNKLKLSREEDLMKIFEYFNKSI